MTKILSEQSIEVYALYRKNSPNVDRIAKLKNVYCIECSLENIEQLPEICQHRGFDVLYHLAWQGASGEQRYNSIIQTQNVMWTLKLVRVAQIMMVKKMVVTGTICENQCEAIIKQNYNGKSAYYLLAKRYCFELLNRECKNIKMPLVWCTFYHPIGEFNKPEQLIMNTILKLQKGDIPQFGKAQKWFDVISADDLCYALYLAGKMKLQKTRYFIGSGKPRILKSYLEEIKDIVNPHIEMQYGVYQDDKLPMKKEWLLQDEFCVETGFVAQTDFRTQIIDICKEP